MINCFKIHGYPEWYKALKNQRAQGTMRVNLANTSMETPLDYDDNSEPHPDSTASHQTSSDMDLSAMIQREIMKYMKGKKRVAQAHFAQTNFAGMTSIPTLKCNLKSQEFSSKKGLWIIDTGASKHMCKDLHLLTDVISLTSPIPVLLHDGKTYLVRQVGRVPLTQGLCLHNVLYLPSFRFNLITVHYLCSSTNLCFHFSSTSCQLQDRKTAEVMVVGKVHGTLYVFDPAETITLPQPPSSTPLLPTFPVICNASLASNNTLDIVTLWHRCFGHASATALKHVSSLSNVHLPDFKNCVIYPLAK